MGERDKKAREGSRDRERVREKEREEWEGKKEEEIGGEG